MEWPKEGRQEVKNIDFLKESLARHDAVLTHLAGILQGNRFYIFYDYASYGDLETFLAEGEIRTSGPLSDQCRRLSYSFSDRFPDYSSDAMFRQMGNLIGALKYLHRDLHVEGSPGMYCAHRDLKPSNVLIFPWGPVGTWKISDFGISTFKSRFKAIKELAAGSPRNRNGTHFAPELHPDYTGTILEAKTDVWSWGCIFAEVLAFGSGKRQAVENFGKCRFDSRNDWFFRRIERRGEHSLRSWSDALSWEGNQFILKSEITDFINTLSGVPDKYCKLVKKVLIPNFDKRPSSAEVYDEFYQTAVLSGSLR